MENPKPETEISITSRRYMVLLGDFSSIRRPPLKWLLTFLLITHHTMITTLGVLIVIGSSKAPSTSLSALWIKIHGLIVPSGQLFLILSWRKRQLFFQLVHELTDLMNNLQMPLAPQIRTQVLRKCEARHRLVTRSLSAGSCLLVLVGVVPPLVTYLLDPSPEKELYLPLGPCDPAPFLTGTGHSLARAVFYTFLATASFVNFIAVSQGGALIILMVDSLKTLFHLNGLVFNSLGSDEGYQISHRVGAIRLHQRLFRLLAQLKTVIEPLLALSVSISVVCNVVCVLAFYKYLSLRSFKYLNGAAVNTMIIALFFILPATTSHKAEEIARNVYFNKSWIARKFVSSSDLRFVIMRASKEVKFRVFNFWVLSSENFIQYLHLSYKFFIAIRFLTERSHEDVLSILSPPMKQKAYASGVDILGELIESLSKHRNESQIPET